MQLLNISQKVEYMNRVSFFDIDNCNANRDTFINLLKNDDVSVLKGKYDWVSKITEEENNRHNGICNKAGLLLGFQIGFASLLLSGNFIDIFSKLYKTEFGLLFTVAVIVIIFALIFAGAYYSLKVGIVPRFKNFIDPTLSLQSYKSEEEWLVEAITESLIVYRKNLQKISIDASRLSLSFNFFLIAVFISISSFMIGKTYNYIIDGTNIERLIIGFILGTLSTLVIRHLLINYHNNKK